MKVVIIHYKPSLLMNSVKGNALNGPITGSTVSARSCDGGWDDDDE